MRTRWMTGAAPVVVCHDKVRRQVSQGYCRRGNARIDPQVPSPSGVHCKPTNVSRLVVKLHSLYRCCLVRRTPYACSPAVYGSVLIVAVRECIVASGSVSVPRPLLVLLLIFKKYCSS